MKFDPKEDTERDVYRGEEKSTERLKTVLKKKERDMEELLRLRK